MSYACEMTQDGRRVATGTLKIACVSKLPDGTMKSSGIPPAISERFDSSRIGSVGANPRTAP